MIGLTSLRPSQQEGCSLSITLHTRVVFNPTGSQAAVLADWAQEHITILKARRSLVLQSVYPTINMLSYSQIGDLQAKHAHNTSQEELHWLSVSIPDTDIQDIKLSLSCRSCGASLLNPTGVFYECTTCEIIGSCAKAKRCMNFTFHVTDDTGSLVLTAHNDDAEALLRISAKDMQSLSLQEQTRYLLAQSPALENDRTTVQVGPSNSLSRSLILKWVLKAVIIR